jgi:hypothetical protein
MFVIEINKNHQLLRVTDYFGLPRMVQDIRLQRSGNISQGRPRHVRELDIQEFSTITNAVSIIARVENSLVTRIQVPALIAAENS